MAAYTAEEGKVDIHPSSVCAPQSHHPKAKKQFIQPKKWQQRDTAGANWLVYWLKQKSSALFLIEVTLVYTLPLIFFGELEVTYGNSLLFDSTVLKRDFSCDLVQTFEGSWV